MNALENIKVILNKLSLIQKALIAGILMACLISGIVLTKWATQPRYQLLFSSLQPQEAGKMIDKIQERGVEYKIGAGGSSIYVSSDKVYEVRLALAKEGLPSRGQKGWSLFEDAKIGESPLAQDVKHLQALQEELAMSIQMIDGVSHARVHLVLPEKTLFSNSPNVAKASVSLSLIGARRLTPANIAAITHLVAGSIEGLAPENVKIVDNNGTLLSGMDQNGVGASTYIDYKEKVQKSLEQKVQKMLEQVLGPGRCTLTICAEIDLTSTETQETSIFGESVPLEEKIAANKKVTGNGSENNSTASNEEKDEETEIKYFVPQKLTKTSEVPGRITSLSVSAMVDLAMEVDGEDNTGTQSQMIMTVEQVKEIIKNAVGREILNDEALTVVNVPFVKPQQNNQNIKSGFGLDQIINIIKQASLAIVAICALLVFKIFTGSKTKSVGTDTELALTGQLPKALPVPNDPILLRKQISSAINKNPEQVTKLFASWIQEG